MLSRGKVTPGSVRYYEAEVAVTPEDYYLGHGEAPGRWVGSGSTAEDLDGEVSAEQLHRLFAAHHPETDEPLGPSYRVRAGVEKVSGGT
ncbi:hypothetical protein BH18ACT1_BH18ACT1_09400 [soil metagenome]